MTVLQGGAAYLLQGGKGIPIQQTASPIPMGIATSQFLQPTLDHSINQAGSNGLSTGSGTYDSGTYTSENNYVSRAPAAPTYNPADLAYLNDQEARLRGQHSSADRALQSGLTQLGDSYNKEVSGANLKQSRALEDFNTKRIDTTKAKDTALGRVDTNARTLADSLRRRIGMASGSDSSAYQLTAPGAVARNASKDRTGVVENHGTNFRNLDTAETRVKDDFTSLLQDLEAQRKTRESDFRAGILEKKNSIDGSLAEVARQRAMLLGGGYNQVQSAMAPYTSAIDGRQAEIDSLFDRYRTPYTVRNVDVRTPDLQNYLVDKAQINANNQSGYDESNPYTSFLKPKEDQYLA